MITQLAKNQVVVITDDKQEFYSYDTLIATKTNDGYILTDKWDYSRTTTKYLCKFLGVANKKVVETMLKNNVIKLA